MKAYNVCQEYVWSHSCLLAATSMVRQQLVWPTVANSHQVPQQAPWHTHTHTRTHNYLNKHNGGSLTVIRCYVVRCLTLLSTNIHLFQYIQRRSRSFLQIAFRKYVYMRLFSHIQVSFYIHTSFFTYLAGFNLDFPLHAHWREQAHLLHRRILHPQTHTHTHTEMSPIFSQKRPTSSHISTKKIYRARKNRPAPPLASYMQI